MRWVLLAVLVIDAALLAVIELFFLPLRLPAGLGGWMAPVTIVLALVTTPLLVRIASTIAPGRVSVAGAPLAVWLLTLLTFGVFGPGGDTVLPIGVRSLALLAAGIVPSAVLLGRVGAASLTQLTAAPPAPPVDDDPSGYPSDVDPPRPSGVPSSRPEGNPGA